MATAVLDDCHAASDVTGRLELSESAAVAVNCAALPTAGAVPLTVTAVTLPGDGVDEDVGGVDVVDGADDGVVGGLVHAAHKDTTAAASRLDALNPRLTSHLATKRRAYLNG